MSNLGAPEVSAVSVAASLPVVPGVEVAVTNSLYGRALIESSDLGFAWRSCASDDVVHCIELTNEERESVFLQLSTDITGLPAVDFDWRSYRGPLRAAAWAASYQGLISILCAAVGVELVVANVQRPAPRNAKLTASSSDLVRIGFAVSRRDGLPVCSGFLQCSSVFAQRILAAQMQPREPCGWRTAPVPIRCIVDEFAIDPVAFNQVESGAIIMLDNRSLSGRKPQVQLGVGGHRFSAGVEGSVLRIHSSPNDQRKGSARENE